MGTAKPKIIIIWLFLEKDLWLSKIILFICFLGVLFCFVLRMLNCKNFGTLVKLSGMEKLSSSSKGYIGIIAEE